MLISAAVGVLLSMISIPTPYYSDSAGPFTTELVLLFLSGLLCTFDLISYKMAKATDADHEPKWPLRRYMIGDLFFALVLQFMFWVVLASLVGMPFEPSHTTVVQAWATLPVFVSWYVICRV